MLVTVKEVFQMHSPRSSLVPKVSLPTIIAIMSFNLPHHLSKQLVVQKLAWICHQLICLGRHSIANQFADRLPNCLGVPWAETLMLANPQSACRSISQNSAVLFVEHCEGWARLISCRSICQSSAEQLIGVSSNFDMSKLLVENSDISDF